jgi:PAS domain S-box-containing protein
LDLEAGRFTLWKEPERLDAMLAELEATGEARDVELSFRTRDGLERQARLMVERIELDGEPCRLTVIEEKTGGRSGKERLREEASWLGRLSDAVRVVDAEGRIRYWNPAAEHLYGWSEREALGQDASRLLGTDEERREEIRRALREHGSWWGHLREVGRDGFPLLVDCHLVELRAAAGGEPCLLITCAPLAVS